MKQMKLPLILSCLLFITSCTGNTLFERGPLHITSQPESTHFFHNKEQPNGFFLHPLSDVDLKAKSAFLIDADRHRVLLDKNSHEALGGRKYV